MPRTATWFAKPAGLGYAALYTMLEPLVRAEGAALWGRQMVLGPTPEFCLHTARPVALPSPLVPVPLHFRPVWP